MNHDRTYRPVRHAPALRLRDADGSLRPHTYGVRVCSCTSIATEPCRPTACAGEYPCCTFTHPATAHYSLLTANSSYTFSAKEKDSETGLSYFGSRYYSSDLSVWLSVDPMSDKYPSTSPYAYCRNNPIILVDPNGMWDAEISENGTCVMFKAEEGDNLHSLAIQLGLSIEDLSDYEGTTFEAGQLYSLDKIAKVNSINNAIALMNNENYNCANFAMFSNGLPQDPAFCFNDGVSSLTEAASLIDSRFSNVSESNTSIGDVVTFGYTEWALRRENNFQDVSELYTPKYTDTPEHYGVVLLKSKDGLSVQKIIEKPGSHAIRLNDYKNYQSDFFTPRHKTNGTTPFYKLR